MRRGHPLDLRDRPRAGAVVFAFSAVVGIKLERWRDDAGVGRPKRGRRLSAARQTAGLACVIGGSALGAGFIIVGGAWIALGVVLCAASIAGGIAIFKTGEEPPPPPPPPDGPKHAGIAYFWHCWLPSRFFDFGRALGPAFVGPPGVIVLLVFEKWLVAAVVAVMTAGTWVALLTVKPKTVPRRGPCLRAE